MEEKDIQLIRCFIAIPLPPEIRDLIDSYIENLKKITQAVKWVKAENCHLTLKFLGDIKEERVEQIKMHLSGDKKITSSFPLAIAGSGCFPNRRKPRVFWLGIGPQGTSDMAGVHQWLDEQLALTGFERETRRFSPHLTLGRVKKDENFNSLFTYLDKKPFSSHTFLVDHFALIRSQLRPQGALYTTLEKFTF